VAGLLAAQDHHLATPNASLAGGWVPAPTLEHQIMPHDGSKCDHSAHPRHKMTLPASLAECAGNRAKMRHRFWAQYKDAELQEAALGGYYSAGRHSPPGTSWHLPALGLFKQQGICCSTPYIVYIVPAGSPSTLGPSHPISSQHQLAFGSSHC
jgi:hypothetical protein